MNKTKPQTVKTKLIVAASVLAIGGGSFAYQTQVHEQKCQAFETQFVQEYDAFTKIVEKNVRMIKVFKVDPARAMELNAMETPSIEHQLDEQFPRMDAAQKAIVTACGEPRFQKLITTMKPQRDKVAKLNEEAHS